MQRPVVSARVGVGAVTIDYSKRKLCHLHT